MLASHLCELKYNFNVQAYNYSHSVKSRKASWLFCSSQAEFYCDGESCWLECCRFLPILQRPERLAGMPVLEAVTTFYKKLVLGHHSLCDIDVDTCEETALGGDWKSTINEYQLAIANNETKEGRPRDRQTYMACLSYYGPDFDCWAFSKDASSAESHNIPNELTQEEKLFLSAAGRTDKAVSACCQVISFYTWKSLSLQSIHSAINSTASESLRVWFVQRVPRAFHAMFSAKWRRYVYLLPIGESAFVSHTIGNRVDSETMDLGRIESLLSPLVGTTRDYYSFARDTPSGKNCECSISKCQVSMTSLPMSFSSDPYSSPYLESVPKVRCLCIEVIANRFLRKMIRVLVSTVVRESIPEASIFGVYDSEALLKIIDARDRRLTAPPAPPEGLCLAGVIYDL